MACDLNSLILSALECPVCLDPIMPPIFQCQNQHLMCGKCLVKLKKCPVCRVKLSTQKPIRNIILEQIAPHVKYPCRFQNHGCQEKVLLQDRKEHSEECDYACGCVCNITDFEGRVIECDWCGREEDIVEHYTTAHSRNIYDVDEDDDVVFSAKHCNGIIKYDNNLFNIKVLSRPTGTEGVSAAFVHIFHVSKPLLQFYMYTVQVAVDSKVPTQSFKGYVGLLKVNICESASRDECLYFLYKDAVTPRFLFTLTREVVEETEETEETEDTDDTDDTDETMDYIL